MSFFEGERPSKSSSSPTKKTIIIAIAKKRIFTKLEYKIKEISIAIKKNATPPKIGTLPSCADLLPATSDNLYLDAKAINFGIVK